MTSGRFQLNSESSTSTNVETGAGASTSTADATNANSNGTSGASLSTEHIRKFVFSGTSTVEGDNIETTAASSPEVVEKLEIKIPELLQSGCYSFYTWPCAPILACFLWERRHALVGKRVLELGSGTALPGILAAKCGAHVVLSDNCILPKSLAHIRKSCLANNLTPGHDIDVIGLSWGLLLNSVFTLGPLDLIIAADCFYDPTVFEDIIVTIAFLLERNPGAKFFFTYQERSADWSIEALLKKWKLCAHQVNIDDLGKCSGVDVLEFMGGHTIHLIEVTLDL